jgi:hypothetical protein
MDSLKIYKVLPLLEDYDNHVVDWIEDLGNLMESIISKTQKEYLLGLVKRRMLILRLFKEVNG